MPSPCSMCAMQAACRFRGPDCSVLLSHAARCVGVRHARQGSFSLQRAGYTAARPSPCIVAPDILTRL